MSRPHADTASRAIKKLAKRVAETVPKGKRFRLTLDKKAVPWWIRWRPSTRRWLRDAERKIEAEMSGEDLQARTREMLETGSTEWVVELDRKLGDIQDLIVRRNAPRPK